MQCPANITLSHVVLSLKLLCGNWSLAAPLLQTRKPFCPKQPCTSVSSVTSAGSQGSPSSLTATNISRASHSQSQAAAPVSHRRCVFLASPCCDSFAKSISRGDLEQGHSYFLARYPSWSIHLWLQGHPEHSGLSGILKCKEKGTCFGNAVAALLGTCKAGLKVWSRREMRNKSLQQADPHLATGKHQTRNASWLQQHPLSCSHLPEETPGLCEAAQQPPLTWKYWSPISYPGIFLSKCLGFF